MDLMKLRVALANRRGETITPELASEIERALCEPAPQTAVALPQTPSREQILHFESQLLKMPQLEIPVTHFFAPGLYCRQMLIPADTALTGDVHLTEHIAIFVGDITVWTEDGMKRLTGHHTFVSQPGAKRVGYAHADTWCTNVWRTDKTTLEEIEAEIAENPHLLQSNRTAHLPGATHKEIAP